MCEGQPAACSTSTMPTSLPRCRAKSSNAAHPAVAGSSAVQRQDTREKTESRSEQGAGRVTAEDTFERRYLMFSDANRSGS